MRVIPMVSAAVVALAGSALAAATAVQAAGGAGGFVLAAETTSTPKVPDGVQGTAPHTGTGMGNATPPAESLGAPRPGTPEPKAQGTAPHTGTALGKDVQPPAQPKVPETPVEMKDITKGTSEGNVSPSERKMGEKPTP